MSRVRKRKLLRQDSDAAVALLELTSSGAAPESAPSASEPIKMVKGSWSREEDAQMLKAVSIHKSDWKLIASKVPGRTAKQCRDRFRLKLDPSINHGPWKPEEDALLLKLHSQVGRQWTKIAKMLNGRTENAVKSRYSSLFRHRTKDWSVEEEARLRQLRESGMSFGEISAQYMPLRSEHAVKKRWEKLVMSDIASRVKKDMPERKVEERAEKGVKLNPALAASTLSSVSKPSEATLGNLSDHKIESPMPNSNLPTPNILGNLRIETLDQNQNTINRFGSSFSFSNVLDTSAKPDDIGLNTPGGGTSSAATVAESLHLNKAIEGIKSRGRRFKRHSTSTTVMMQLLGEPLP